MSSIYKFIFQIQQILGSHELKGHSHDNVYPKTIDLTFSLLGFVQACKKISLFHLFFFEIQPILELHNQTGYTRFWPCLPKKITTLSAWISTSLQKSVNSICSLLRNRERDFSKIWDLGRNTTNCIIFII